eukprot:12933202-Prorocentrum_lima.AAC.1
MQGGQMPGGHQQGGQQQGGQEEEKRKKRPMGGGAAPKARWCWECEISSCIPGMGCANGSCRLHSSPSAQPPAWPS